TKKTIDGYTLSKITMDGTDVTSTGSTAVTTVAGENTVEVEDTYTKDTVEKKGNVKVTKEVTGDGAPADATFTVTAEATKGSDPIEGTFDATGITGATTVTFDEGKATFSIKAGDTVEIKGLPDGTEVVFGETNMPADFSLTTDEADRIATVDADASATPEVKLTNAYTKPVVIEKGYMSFTKTVTGLESGDEDLADGITFTVTKDGSTTPIATFTYADLKAMTNSTWVSGELDLGTYTVTETDTGITGYDSKITTTTSSVEVKAENTASAPAAASLTNEYEKQQTEPTKYDVYITKAEMADGSKEVEGASLTLYDKDGNVVESWKSEKTTHKVSLVPGDYTLVETLLPENDIYHVQSEDVTFTVGDDGKVASSSALGDDGVVMIDDLGGAFTVKVVEEETGTPVPNATIEITKPDGTTETVTTDENGEVIVTNLPDGEEYTYKVVKVPDDYDVKTGGTDKVTIEKGKTIDKTEEIAPKAEPKTDATTEEKTTTEEQTTTEEKTTEEQPDDEDEEEDEDEEDEDTGTLIVTVIDEKTGKPVPNATVEITNPDGTKGTYTTDENGQIKLTELPAGEYKVVVTKVPDGYSVTTGKVETVTVEEGKTTKHTAMIAKTEDSPAKSATSKSVKTSDNAKLIPIIIVMVLSLAFIVVIIIRKRRINKNY
ncbi:MAG: carboxypeptidase regulatory-like domain-containing protein, partial [Eubacterium sp.]|nr:carboxypeptidase regulatory-like domain-containing protein [Eubacterium sp.]